MVVFYLTCVDKTEAIAIGEVLLNARVVACVKQSVVESSYWRDGKIESNNEILLMMESVAEKFDAVNKIVAELHSYDEYALTMVPVERTTVGVEKWLQENLS